MVISINEEIITDVLIIISSAYLLSIILKGLFKYLLKDDCLFKEKKDE